MSGSRPAGEKYEIRIKGHLSERAARLFDGFDVEMGFHDDGTAISILAGAVADQPALHGTLTQIRDLGMEIVSVNRVGESPQK